MQNSSETEKLAAKLFPVTPATYAEYEAAHIACDQARRANSPDFERLAKISDATYWSYADGVEAKASRV